MKDPFVNLADDATWTGEHLRGTLQGFLCKGMQKSKQRKMVFCRESRLKHCRNRATKLKM